MSDWNDRIKALLPDVLGAVADGKVTQDEILQIVMKHLPSILAEILTKPKPKPIPTQPDGLPIDDTIPQPPKVEPGPPAPAPVTVASVGFKIERVQYSAKLFPNEAGKVHGFTPGEAIPYDSKIWFDTTVTDSAGKRHTEADTLAAGLEWHPAVHVICPDGAEVVFRDGGEGPVDIEYLKQVNKGQHRMDEDDPRARRYWAVDGSSDTIGFGSAAWRWSWGYLFQAKVFGEGNFKAWVEVDGVASPSVAFSVS